MTDDPLPANEGAATLAPSVADMIFAVAAPIKAIDGAVRLTQSDGDLAAHIRMGDVILATRHIPTASLASYTAVTNSLVAHAWLSEVLFAVLFRTGGLALIAVFTAIVIGLTHASVAVFLRAKGVDPRWALVGALSSLALSASHWLARPHMFTIAGSLVTILLLESSRRRLLLFAITFALWANLHGGWLFGIVTIAAYSIGEAAEYLVTRDPHWKARARESAIAAVVATAATLLNPYGMGLHREVISAVTSSSLAGSISEYMAPNFQELAALPFLIAIIASVLILSLIPRRMALPHLAVFLLSLLAALQSFRNIALFGVTGWPLLMLHAYRGWPVKWRRFPWFGEVARLDAHTRVGLWGVPMMALLLALGLARGRVFGAEVIADRFDRGRLPVEAVSLARADSVTGRVFHPWVWGGYMMLSWPEAKLFVDPLKFSDETMSSYTTIAEVRPGWQRELARWRVQTVIMPPRALLTKALAGDSSWRRWHSDSTAVVFRHLPSRPAQR